MKRDEDDAGEVTEDEEEKTPLATTEGRKLPTNQESSCYVDSVLMALFHFQDRFIEFLFTYQCLSLETQSTKMLVPNKTPQDDLKFRKSFQKQIKQFISSMRTKKKSPSPNECVKIIRTMLLELKLMSGQQDAGEFLMKALEVLQLNDNVNKLHEVVFVTNNLLDAQPFHTVMTSNRCSTTGCLFHLTQPWHPEDNLLSLFHTSSDSGVLANPIRTLDGKSFFRAITTTEFIPSQFFIVFADRTIRAKDNVPDRTPLDISEFVETNGRKFHLHAAVLHRGNLLGGHYTCILQDPIKKTWFVYDDVTTILTSGGSFQEVARNTNANVHAVLLFYSS